MNLETLRNLELFEELITCSRRIYFWHYDPDFNLIHSNCPDQNVLSRLFSLEHKKEYLLSYFENEQLPVILTNSFDLAWAVDSSRDTSGKLTHIWAIGPIFLSEISAGALEHAISQYGLSVQAKNEILSALKKISFISFMNFTEYTQMLHYCVTQEKIPYSQIRLFSRVISQASPNVIPETAPHGTWVSEQTILKMIEDGNLDYRKKQDKLGQIGHVGKLSSGEPLRQYKNQIISFIVLATRAAIRGGLSPETAYTLSDLYIQNVESSNSLDELATVSYIMQEDFVQRVHQCKIEVSISPYIKKCRDYIQLHITEKINLKELSSYIGYSQNYLCKKFKEETGTNIRDYINMQKIERSKDFLISTTYTVLDISEILHFSSPSYFCELFHKLTGSTPKEYRNQKPR